MDESVIRVNEKGWNEQLDAKLLLAVIQEQSRIRQNNEDDVDWDRIGLSIPDKTAVQCLQRYMVISKQDNESDDNDPPAKRRKSNSSEAILDSTNEWKKEEESLLQKLVDLNPEAAQFWGKVAAHFLGHDAMDCFAKWLDINDPPVGPPAGPPAVIPTVPPGTKAPPGIKDVRGHDANDRFINWHSTNITNPRVGPPDIKAPSQGPDGRRYKASVLNWTAEEDQIIRDKYAIYGGQWETITQFLPGRDAKNVRERYMENLNPNLKKGNWTDEEEVILIALHYQYGNRWAMIAKALPGRSYNDVRNRWCNKVQKKIEKYGEENIVKAALEQVKIMQEKGTWPSLRQEESQPPPQIYQQQVNKNGTLPSLRQEASQSPAQTHQQQVNNNGTLPSLRQEASQPPAQTHQQQVNKNGTLPSLRQEASQPPPQTHQQQVYPANWPAFSNNQYAMPTNYMQIPYYYARVAGYDSMIPPPPAVPGHDRPYEKYMHKPPLPEPALQHKDRPYSKYMNDKVLRKRQKESTAADQNNQPYRNEGESSYGDKERHNEQGNKPKGGEKCQEPALSHKVSAGANQHHQQDVKEERARGEEDKPKDGVNREETASENKESVAAGHNHQQYVKDKERACGEEEEKEKPKGGVIREEEEKEKPKGGVIREEPAPQHKVSAAAHLDHKSCKKGERAKDGNKERNNQEEEKPKERENRQDTNKDQDEKQNQTIYI